jgi:putative transposase
MPKDTQSTLPADADLALPEQVTVALAELAGAAREGLLALAVGTGIRVLGELLAADVQRLVGPKGRHNPTRAAVRHGTQPGKVTLGGRRLRVDRPRVRSADGTAELPLATWQAFAGTQLLDQLALERMLAKLSTRRYRHGLEPGRQPSRTGELGDLQVGGLAPVREPQDPKGDASGAGRCDRVPSGPRAGRDGIGF